MARSLVEYIYRFLFHPARAARENLADPSANSWLVSAAFALYLSVILGVTFWYFVFYPEPLYYGLSGAALQKEIPAIVIADPRVSLLVLISALITAIFGQNFLLGGALTFAVMKKIGGDETIAFSRFLSLYAFGLSPLLFWVPLMALRLFFFERWMNLKPLYPFIDFNTPNIIHLLLAAFFIAWKCAIEVRLNQAAFKVTAARALVPVLIEAAMFAGLLLAPLALNNFLFNAFKDTLT